MPSLNSEVLEAALEIISKLLAGDEVADNKNTELYRKYITNYEIEECVELICEKLDLSVYKTIDGKALVLTPGVENKVFGYNNEELKRKLGLGSVPRLYTAYFIIMTIITMFYKESAMDSSVPYLLLDEIINEVDRKFTALVQREDLEAISGQYSYNFAALAKAWEQMVLKKDEEDQYNRGFKDKISAVNTVCNFLEDEKLLIIEEYRGMAGGVVPTDRFKAIIYNYFEDRGNKSAVLDFMRNLGDE